MSDIVSGSEMTKRSISLADLVARESEDTEGFRAEWQRLAPAREFAAMLIGHRADNGLTQTALSRVLEVSQARVAQLESGERNPDLETIIAVVSKLGTEFVVDVRGSNVAAHLVSERARSEGTEASHGDVTVTAASRLAISA